MLKFSLEDNNELATASRDENKSTIIETKIDEGKLSTDIKPNLRPKPDLKPKPILEKPTIAQKPLVKKEVKVDKELDSNDILQYINENTSTTDEVDLFS